MNSDDFQLFFKGVTNSFTNNPYQVLISFSAVLLIILIFIFIIIIYKKKNEIKEFIDLKKKYKETVQNKNLTEREKEILFDIADNYINNKKDITEILINPLVFSNYTKNLINSRLVTENEMAVLRMKLNLVQKKIFNILYSTADLPIGTSIKLFFSKGYYFKGIISDNDETGVSINIDTDIKIEKNHNAVIEFDNSYGFFLIHTRIIEIKNSIIKVDHSENIERVQKRKFFRKNIRLPITIKKNDDDKGINSYLLDLSGGGAKIYYTKEDYKIGEKLIIIILLNKNEEIIIHAVIKRISKSESAISVSFSDINESIRDKIIKATINYM